MTTYWQPCKDGEALYRAYRDAMEYETESLDLAARAEFAWYVWKQHRDSCDRCKIGGTNENN